MTSFNDLPDDCLTSISDYIHDLKQLLQLSEVCPRWGYLVENRLKKVQKLDIWWSTLDRSFKPDYIYTNDYQLIEKINISSVLPNLKYVRVGYISMKGDCLCKALANIMNTGNPLIGLSVNYSCDQNRDKYLNQSKCKVDMDQQIVKYCDKVKYLSADINAFTESFFKKFEFGANVIKFSTIKTCNTLTEFASSMVNLESAKIVDFDETDCLYDGPSLMKLNQLSIFSYDYTNLSYELLEYFPNLKNLLLKIILRRGETNYFGSIVNRNIENLVIYLVEDAPPTNTNSLHALNSILKSFPTVNIY
ncbi:uncharacterized protein LOC128394487 [Panonychus citri]|uniref:uncharacterized protein LOC128394487 n=1 Tax=Panonychus citri TaxID=50023 RepID=UPI002307612E|nr:uncharacterized protein LOC128394487 [Panonychus citri]